MREPSFLSEQPYIIAEAGVNHNGDPALAKQLIDAAKKSGANAVKFQLFNPEEISSASAPLADYQKDAGEENQLDMLKSLTLSHDAYRELAEYAKACGIDFIVTPFDAESAEFLVSLPVVAIKIPSGEVTNIPFLKRVAALQVPVILSTGMCTAEEVRDAVNVFAETELVLLHCTSSYPTPLDQINLRAMKTLQSEFGLPVGLSDHSEGIAVPIAAAALGAIVIEKHFTLDRTMKGPDHKASLEPAELTAMVQGIRAASAALGSSEKIMQPAEMNTATVARRSVVATKDLSAGTVLTTENTALKRPGTGIPPKDYELVIGKSLSQDVAAGTPITTTMLS